MDAGRELDERIAREVMGGPAQNPNWWWWKNSNPPLDLGDAQLWAGPAFSTDIAAAWQVVERMTAREHGLELWRPNTEGFSFVYEAKFYSGRDEFVGQADTAPLAISRAALAAVGAAVPA